MYKIPYDASRKSLYHPGDADNFFQFGFALTDEKVLCAEMSRLAYVKEIRPVSKPILAVQNLICIGQ